ncbi:DUF4954 family protein [Prolixibacteraceae bacterium]|nr:DUF4954 family protein [Prolixibacteraceae bacterium]
MYENLTVNQITTLESNGCTSSDWKKVLVKQPLNCERIKHVQFHGNIRLGVFDDQFILKNGIKRSSGIYYATLSNCTIGDNCRINNIQNYIANYTIENHVRIESLNTLEVEGETSFGNGIKVSVLDETGGRQVPIFDQLSAHLAYIIALYRHRDRAIKELEEMIQKYADKQRASVGIIGEWSIIENCKEIKNTRVGKYTTITNTHRLNNGSINSVKKAPVRIGSGVIANNFIVASGSEISDSAILDHCFVGQGCKLSKHYSAENSLFFANCQGYHGEACSIFAGPYTVTHHKSTLLIAGLYSFMNAGSGSNQSNHMYKLGPIHAGIMQRGSKTASDSYILWPAKIGPFTLVMGRHYKNSDTSDLPFSYLIEKNDESYLAPAVNIKSVGTIRDAVKWPKRDKRTDTNKLDLINCNLLSPFTINKMYNGRSILKQLQTVSGATSESYNYMSTKITAKSLNRGIQLYSIGITKFLGNSVISRINNMKFNKDKTIQEVIKPSTSYGKGQWVDLAGLITPKEVVTSFMDKIEQREIKSLKQVKNYFEDAHANYYEYEWTWASDLLEKELDKSLDEIEVSDIISLIGRWRDSVIELDKMLYNDAKKEFTLSSRTGFGPDGDDSVKIKDFEQVRGTFETNSVVNEIIQHIHRKSKLAADVIDQLKEVTTSA